MGIKKGTKFTEQHKRRIGKAHEGKNHSEETKRKMSITMLKKWKEWKRNKTGRMKLKEA